MADTIYVKLATEGTSPCAHPSDDSPITGPVKLLKCIVLLIFKYCRFYVWQLTAYILQRFLSKFVSSSILLKSMLIHVLLFTTAICTDVIGIWLPNPVNKFATTTVTGELPRTTRPWVINILFHAPSTSWSSSVFWDIALRGRHLFFSGSREKLQ